MSNAYHLVHYRKFVTDGLSMKGQTLESLCRTVLSKEDSNGVPRWERVTDRLLDLADAEHRQVILNRVADLSTAVFGEMCLVQSHGFQALLKLQASKVELSNLTVAEIYALQESAAPQGSQFIRGMAYWLSVGDHLFFVKTQAMTPPLLRDYLAWLIGAVSDIENFEVRLQAEFDKSQVAGDIGDIRTLRVSGKSAPQLHVAAVPKDEKSKEIKTSRTVAAKWAEFDQALPVVQALFGKARADSLVESLGPKEYLAVDASVKVRGQRTAESRDAVKELANELADVTDGKVQVEGKDGKISDDDAILRTRMPFKLLQDGSSLLEFNDVATQLQEVYSRFVHDGKIKA